MKKIFAVLLSLTMIMSMATSSLASNTISVNKTAEDTEAALEGAKFDVYGNNVDIAFGGGELKDVITADNEYSLAFSGGEVVTLQDDSTARLFRFLTLAAAENSDMGLDLKVNGEAAAADAYKNIHYNVTYNYGDGFVSGGAWDGYVKSVVATDGTLTLEVKGSCVAKLTATYGDVTDSVVIVVPGDTNMSGAISNADASKIDNMWNLADHMPTQGDSSFLFELADLNGDNLITAFDSTVADNMSGGVLAANDISNPNSPYTSPVAFTTGDATPETEEVRTFVFLKLADVENSDMSLDLTVNGKDATADMYKGITLDVKYNYGDGFVAGGAWDGYITPSIDDDGVMTIKVKSSCVAQLTASYTYNGVSDEDSVVIVVPGDIDKTGDISPIDATEIDKMWGGVSSTTPILGDGTFLLELADMDGDERITTGDAIIIDDMFMGASPTNDSRNSNSPYTAPVTTTVGTEEIEAYSVLIASGVTDENGSYTFENLPYDGSYKLVETEAPAGYKVVDPIIVDITNENASEDIEDPLADTIDVTYPKAGTDEDGDNVPDNVTDSVEVGKTITVDPADGTWRETSDPTELEAEEDITLEDPTAPDGKTFIGWNSTDDGEGNKTYTAQYEDDANDDGIPDKYQAEVTFTATDATFDDGTTTKTETVTLVDEDGKWSEDGSAVIEEAPAVTPDENFKDGSWDKEFPLTVTEDTTAEYTATAINNVNVTYKENGKDENNDNIPDETTSPLKEGNTLTVDPGDGTWRETSDPTEITAGTDDIDVEDPTAPEGKIFTGWTETEDEDGNKTLTAQYEDDANEDGIPDKYQTEITYKAKDGKFDDGTTTKTQTVTLVDENGKWSESGFAVIGEAPIVTPNNGFMPGTWDKTFPLIVTKEVTATYTAVARADTEALITYDTDGKGTTENKLIEKAEEILIKPNGGSYEGSTEDQYRIITIDTTLTKPIRQGFIFAGWTVEETQVPVTKFDFNRDGIINETDMTILQQLVSGSITPIIFDEINFYHYLFNVGYETGTDNRMFDDNDINAISRQINKMDQPYTANMPASLMRFFGNYPNAIESAQAHRVIYTFTANWTEEPPIYKIETSDHVAYMIGYTDGTFNPNGSITRAEAATVLFRMLTDNVRNSYMSISNAFTDVPNEYWANKAISTLAKLGILDVTSGEFRPNDPITRGELATMFANSKLTGTQEYTISFSDVVANTRENKDIMACAKLGLFKGYPDGTFRADSNMTRAEFAAGILRVLNRANEQDSCKYITNGLVKFTDIDSTAWYYMSVIEITNSHIAKYINDVEKEWTKLNQTPDWATYEK